MRGAAGRTAPLVDGEVGHLVLIGDVEAEHRDPIGIAVHADRAAAEQSTVEELRRTGDHAPHPDVAHRLASDLLPVTVARR